MTYYQKTELEEKNHEMIELLKKLNIARPVALTLVCLSSIDKTEITSREIERITGLRQPEVSIAMRHLRKNNWIEIREEKKDSGKGRPIKLYNLIVSLDKIISNIELEVISKNTDLLKNIEKFKSMSVNPSL
ncbi:MAG: transcriptional regulator [Methanosarcinaceae archaeon]|jgi:predicted transcriptional regulator|nr:transcriptional regulator [Methanosarcinaceae archaeon]NKQ38434.1 transcriptional regulator [Methanosarcinales archaeon]